ncbi:unnamed protein product [Ceratitis capitata]|uniref:(Mediterranean fruit fly) hypothetical protein n=1 Tax=Ceratitis capitata TaxID=7213 RepID=A0A811US96_CERCA|nr:unnamed protein product [Ceratitis capitata]
MSAQMSKLSTRLRNAGSEAAPCATCMRQLARVRRQSTSKQRQIARKPPDRQLLPTVYNGNGQAMRMTNSSSRSIIYHWIHVLNASATTFCCAFSGLPGIQLVIIIIDVNIF